MEMKQAEYYQVVEVYKKLIKQKKEEGKDSRRLKRRLLAIMLKNGKNKSTHSV